MKYLITTSLLTSIIIVIAIPNLLNSILLLTRNAPVSQRRSPRDNVAGAVIDISGLGYFTLLVSDTPRYRLAVHPPR